MFISLLKFKEKLPPFTFNNRFYSNYGQWMGGKYYNISTYVFLNIFSRKGPKFTEHLHLNSIHYSWERVYCHI